MLGALNLGRKHKVVVEENSFFFYVTFAFLVFVSSFCYTLPLYRILCSSYTVPMLPFFSSSSFGLQCSLYYFSSIFGILSILSDFFFFSNFNFFFCLYGHLPILLFFPDTFPLVVGTGGVYYSQIGIDLVEDAILCLNLFASSSSKHVIEFYVLQEKLFLFFSELSLVFFRLFNMFSTPIVCFSVYLLYPDFFYSCLYKLQCFCFGYLYIEPLETVDLPVLYYVLKNHQFNLCSVCDCWLSYVLLNFNNYA